MSLPQAPKDISSKPKVRCFQTSSDRDLTIPQAGAVTDPVNKKLKNEDIDRKVRRP